MMSKKECCSKNMKMSFYETVWAAIIFTVIRMVKNNNFLGNVANLNLQFMRWCTLSVLTTQNTRWLSEVFIFVIFFSGDTVRSCKRLYSYSKKFMQPLEKRCDVFICKNLPCSVRIWVQFILTSLIISV